MVSWPAHAGRESYLVKCTGCGEKTHEFGVDDLGRCVFCRTLEAQKEQVMATVFNTYIAFSKDELETLKWALETAHDEYQGTGLHDRAQDALRIRKALDEEPV